MPRLRALPRGGGANQQGSLFGAHSLPRAGLPNYLDD
jgi:hypothetical protein